MEIALSVFAFLGAAFVGLVEGGQIAEYLENQRWLRIGALVLAFFLMAAILTGGPRHS